MRWSFVALGVLATLFFASGPAAAQHQSVAGTLHNLSVSGPGEIRATRETEICKFCHIPHNAVVPAPLWGRRLSTADYTTPELRRGRPGARSAPQPDGASRLCLSCHDGTIALGEIAGEARPIEMQGGGRLQPGRRGFLGTDLTGSHPISFRFPDEEESRLLDSDLALRPLAAVRSDPDVRLDGERKMQCTTCHDAHSDRFFVPGKVPRFWVKPTIDEVCTTCHALG